VVGNMRFSLTGRSMEKYDTSCFQSDAYRFDYQQRQYINS